MLIFNEQSCILARRLDEYAKQPNQTHDLYPYISACTLDIIAGLFNSLLKDLLKFIIFIFFLEAATGTHPNAQSSDGENEFVEATVR